MIRIICLLLFFIFALPLFSAPLKSDVQKVMEKEKQDQIKVNKRIQLFSDIFKKIFLNKNFKNLMIYSFIFFVVLIILIVLFFIIRAVSSRNYLNLKNEDLKTEHKDFIFERKYLDELLKDKEYKLAIIYLHRSTIFYLIKNQIAYNKNLTNYSLYSRIKNNDVREAFKKLYQYSEIILFDNYDPDYKEAMECKEVYLKNFKE